MMARMNPQEVLAVHAAVQQSYREARERRQRIKKDDDLFLQECADYAWHCYRRGEFDRNYIIGRNQ